jgi:SAM-dependent MidA family methyltransferase
MEEQKKNKVVNMDTKQAGKKLSYEQLNDACNQLLQQNRQLAIQNKQLEQFAMNKRLDYLFKVIEFSKEFTSDFVGNCASEIEEALTIPQEEKKGE